MKIDFARNIALKILYEVNVNAGYLNIVFNNYINQNSEKLSKIDVNFINKLVDGVITWKLTLEYIIQKYSNVKIKKMSGWVRNILYLGVYQIVFLDKIPKSAAVNESVNLCKKYNYKSTSLVNAILRKVEKADYEEIKSIKDDLKRISIQYSMPEWIVRKLIEQYGNDVAEDICKSSNIVPEISVRLNRLKDKIEIGDKGLLEDFRIIRNMGDVSRTDEYKKGYITVQDEAVALSAVILNPKEGEEVLDACSAPGGKTTYLAEIMNNKGNIIAWDIYKKRLKEVNDNAERLGINIIKTEVHDARKLKEEYMDKFDKILLDVPCMGLGVIKRKPDIKWNRKEEDIDEIINIQYKILKQCSKYLKKGSLLEYSTCSILKEENELVIEKFVKEENFEIINIEDKIPNEFTKIINNGMVQLLPSKNHDGFFIALLKKN